MEVIYDNLCQLLWNGYYRFHFKHLINLTALQTSDHHNYLCLSVCIAKAAFLSFFFSEADCAIVCHDFSTGCLKNSGRLICAYRREYDLTVMYQSKLSVFHFLCQETFGRNIIFPSKSVCALHSFSIHSIYQIHPLPNCCSPQDWLDTNSPGVLSSDSHQNNY